MAYEVPEWHCEGSCNCVIDLSSPETLERDFHNWLKPSSFSPSTSTSTSSTPETCEEETRKTKRTGTNLYGRPYCPGRPLRMEERRKIVELHLGGMKVNAISKTLCISHGCVSKIIARFRHTGLLSPASSPEARRSRRRKTTEEDARHSDSSTSSPRVAGEDPHAFLKGECPF